MKNTTIVVANTVIAAAFAVSTNAALNPENRLPENTLVVLTIKNISKSIETLKTSSLGLLIKDPSMKPFLDYVLESNKDEFTAGLSILKEKKINLADYKDLFKGEVVLAVSDIFVNDLGYGYMPVAMAEFEGGSEKLSSCLTDLSGKLGMTFTAEKLGTTEFTIIPITKDHRVWAGAQDSIFYLAHSSADEADLAYTRDALTRLTTKQEGGTPLVENKLFNQHAGILANKNYLWFNFSLLNEEIKGYAQAMDKKYEAPADIEEAMTSMPRPISIYNSLGLGALKSGVLTLWTEGKDIFLYTKLVCPVNERSGITELLNALENRDCSPTEMIPADVLSFSRMNINFPKLWKVIDETTTGIFGGMKAVYMENIFGNLEEKEKSKLNLRADILENLTGECMVLDLPVKKVEIDSSFFEDEDNSANGETILLGVKDGDRFLKAIRGLCACLEMDELETEDLMGLFSKFGNYIAIIGDKDKPEVKKFLARKAKSLKKNLAKDKELMAAVDKVGGADEITVLAYANYKSQVQYLYLLWDSIEKFLKDETEDDSKFRQAGKKLPEFDVISKYFGFAVSSTKVTPEGLETLNYYPWPTGLKE